MVWSFFYRVAYSGRVQRAQIYKHAISDDGTDDFSEAHAFGISKKTEVGDILPRIRKGLSQYVGCAVAVSVDKAAFMRPYAGMGSDALTSAFDV